MSSRVLLSDPYRKQTTQIEIEKKGDKQPVKALTCVGMFYDFQKVTTADISGLDTSEVKFAEYMFAKCHALTSLDLSKLNPFSSKPLDMSARMHAQ